MDIKTKRLFYVTIFSLVWSLQVIIDKYALNIGIEPLSFAYQTLFGAALISTTHLIITRPKDLKTLKKKNITRLASVGVIGSGLGTVAMFYGLKYSTAINYGFLIKSTVIFSILLAYIFLNEALTKKKIFYTMILIMGSYLISTGGKYLVPHIGDLIIILAAFFLSSAAIIAKPLIKKHSAEIVTTFRTFFGGAIILMLIPFLTPEYHIIHDMPLLILRSIFTFLTLYLLNKTIEISSISYTTTMSMMFSVFTAIMGYAIFNETMNTFQILGALLIIVSVAKINNSNI